MGLLRLALQVVAAAFLPIWLLATASIIQLVPWIRGGEIQSGDGTTIFLEVPLVIQVFTGGGLALVVVGGAATVAIVGTVGASLVSAKISQRQQRARASQPRTGTLPADVVWDVEVHRVNPPAVSTLDVSLEETTESAADAEDEPPSDETVGPASSDGYAQPHVSTDSDREPG